MVPSWGRDMRLLNCIVLIPQAVVVLLITKLAALIYHLFLLFKFSLSIWLVLRKLLLLILSLRLHLKVMTAHLGFWVTSGVTLLICPLDLHPRFNIFSLGRLERLLSRRSRPFRDILQASLIIRWSELGLGYTQTLLQERWGLGPACLEVFDLSLRKCLFAPTFSLQLHRCSSSFNLLFYLFIV